MNEADTRAERIDPQLKATGWGVIAPPLPVQKRIVEKLDAASAEVKRLKDSYIKKNKNLFALKSLVLQPSLLR